ncbi:hypothetical protein SAMN05443999_11230 [Roseovarius azorensis]|uniref:Uncharacterized protein n=1 Tax=Roseovarius azorensis TaxID=1287727 RepID=A0A1H7VBW9_9RHOB|nr:hypothetical protein [Roseovarius azorensis]SEM06534.1 hypothetical protein SAMN05443999_11230 [Roseovarius azorensis]
MPRLLLLIASLLFLPVSLSAQATVPESEAPPTPEYDAAPEAPMTLARLDEIIRALDAEAQSNGTMWQITINDVQILIVTDAAADRMRAITPVLKTEEMTPEDITRVLQANFDTALDARYAIANEILWSAFIHPLKPLEKDQLISGLGQVVNLAQSYGTLYSGGALQYGGGDSGALQRQLIDDLLKKGEEI